MKTPKNESGIVSIFVTMLLIVIMSLLVMAFAQVSRREQRESLDSQLSSQAYYAAETGINDAKSAITNFINANPSSDLPVRKTCNDSSNYSELNDPANKNLNADGSVAYTCVTVDPTPPYLSATVGDQAQIVPVKMADGGTVNNLTLKWTGTTDWAAPTAAQMAQCAATKTFPADTNGCPYGGLRIDIVPTDPGTSRANLNDNTMTAFVMPRNTSGAGTAAYRTGGNVTQGVVVDASNCATGACSVRISGLTARSYYMRITRLYLGSDVRITNGGRTFKDSQATIDSTGKAQDVLRRILVSVPLQSDSRTTPNSALISGDSVCKRFSVYDGFISQGFTGTFPGADNNPLCQQVSTGSVPNNPLCTQGYDIALVTDASTSMINNAWETYPTREAELKNVANIFAGKVYNNAYNRVSLISFNGSAQQLTVPDFVTTSAKLKSAINSITNAVGTNYMAGLQMADSVLSQSSTNTRKAIIFISDGYPDSGGTDAQILAETNALKARNVEIYTILITTNANQPATLMQKMASNPSGTFYRNALTTTDFESYFGSTVASSFPCGT